MTDSTPQYVFVYGTLKRGHSRNHHLPPSSFVADAVTTPHWLLYDLGSYPGLVVAETGVAVRGELYAVDDTLLEKLDEVECVNLGLYTRERVMLATPDVEGIVWTYCYAESVSGRAPIGSVWPVG